jgi:hypothetical protein
MRSVRRFAFSFPLWALTLDMRTRGALGFEERRGRRYPLSLATTVVLPALALAVRAGTDLNFESYAPLIGASVLTALAICVLFWHFDPQLRGDLNQCATIAIFALAYSYGVLAFADVRLDLSPGRDTQTVVHHKRIHVSGGPKGSSVWYQVQVDPDASPAGANWINIRPDLWDSFQRGDTVCVHLGTGSRHPLVHRRPLRRLTCENHAKKSAKSAWRDCKTWHCVNCRRGPP